MQASPASSSPLPLINLAAEGLRPQCGDPETHTFAYPSPSNTVPRLSAGGPATARRERFGVWAGRDLSR